MNIQNPAEVTMLVGEIVFGVLALITGTLLIYLASREKITPASFQKVSGKTTTRLVTYGLLGSLFFCLIGLLMILRGLGVFR